MNVGKVDMRKKENKHLLTIFVKTLSDSKIKFHKNENSTIMDIKMEINSKTWLPIEQQKLVCNTRYLKDNTKTLKEYNIKNKDVIYITL